MKTKFYLHTSMIGLLSICFSIQKVNAQCNCSPGVPASAVTYYYTLAPTDAPTSHLTFPQFNASIGTLSCITFRDTISGTTTTGVRNRASSAVDYTFDLTVSNTFKGPDGSFTYIQPLHVPYGPDILDAYGTPGDTITYGPGNIFSGLTGVKQILSTAPYLGIGNIDIEYTLNGGVTTLDGGFNYTFGVSTIYSGNFSLTYYWCPHTPLSSKNKKSPSIPTPSAEVNSTQPLSIYPNPLSGGKFSLQFNKPVTGSYRVDVVNSTGQKIYSGNLQVNNTQRISVDMNSIPPSGLYYLRAADQRTGAVHMNKLLVK
ncbi:MAG TPA: choice-of-anchor E domain-containing protein [Chitinophagaceae bacterium]|nr:choice-of-anchor E domain-containing protein [Chitinophagaceae bacterium]